MPGGIVHGLTTIATGAITAGAMAYLQFTPEEIAPAMMGFALTLYINPDMDLNAPFSKDKPRTWLPWIYMWPYSRAIPHRSPLSHLPGYSTFIRAVYILPPILLAMKLMLWEYQVNWDAIWIVFFAMCASDLVHAVLDTTVTAIKRSIPSWAKW